MHILITGAAGMIGRKLVARLVAAGKSLRLLRRADIDQRELIDRLAVKRTGSNQARHELAPDHSGGAGDENAVCS